MEGQGLGLTVLARRIASTQVSLGVTHTKKRGGGVGGYLMTGWLMAGQCEKDIGGGESGWVSNDGLVNGRPEQK